ncbi:YqgE/AlgH family protein [Nigerium massiliense]|uniref:YqgE/AlgH family protein n=1 Tax=Nigerium massiliense TaxID=1522317 RepID=UPI0009E3CCCA|nr:YqgE/AlgH family protein [Nigerium massiliense]
MTTSPIEPGLLLVSSPALSDGVFDQAVVFVLDADASGALGVRLDRLSGFDLETALPGWAALASFPAVLFDGGPVSPEGAICLAAPLNDGEEPPGWRPLYGGIGLLHLDTPLEIAAGAYRDLRVFAGYAGWGPGQLDAELDRGLWHAVSTRYSDVFDPDPSTLWRRVLRRQGGALSLLAGWTATPELN